MPSFARQTGQPCGTCHTDFPALTPFGRRFKLLGYTVGGGKYATTPFQTLVPWNHDAQDNSEDKSWVPPISMMAIAGFTHTQAPLPPPTSPYQSNDNVVVTPISAFWGGAITSNIGAFAQVTYNAPPPGGFSDPFGHTWTWDNTDIRYADTARIGFLDVIYGITANNNPTVQDVWNTTPAWAFPYAISNIASTPATHTIIEGTFAAHVGSVGGYAMFNDLIYVEATAYRTLDFRTQNALGVDPLGAPGLFDVAPYWRLAAEPRWGERNWLEIGTFGMYAPVHPFLFGINGSTSTDTFGITDKYTDIGFDTQYQYMGDNFWFTLRGSYIREEQHLDASQILSGTNLSNSVNTLRAQGALSYGNDNRIVLTGQHFNIWGTRDPALYASLAGCAVPTSPGSCTPDSEGWIAELSYIPFGMSASPGWPWFNTRIGLQYTWYNKFDGTSVGAAANNTLFLYAWLAW